MTRRRLILTALLAVGLLAGVAYWQRPRIEARVVGISEDPPGLKVEVRDE